MCRRSTRFCTTGYFAAAHPFQCCFCCPMIHSTAPWTSRFHFRVLPLYADTLNDGRESWFGTALETSYSCHYRRRHQPCTTVAFCGTSRRRSQRNKSIGSSVATFLQLQRGGRSAFCI